MRSIILKKNPEIDPERIPPRWDVNGLQRTVKDPPSWKNPCKNPWESLKDRWRQAIDPERIPPRWDVNGLQRTVKDPPSWKNPCKNPSKNPWESLKDRWRQAEQVDIGCCQQQLLTLGYWFIRIFYNKDPAILRSCRSILFLDLKRFLMKPRSYRLTSFGNFILQIGRESFSNKKRH